MSVADTEAKVPGWDEALRELVAADFEFVEAGSAELSEAALGRFQTALGKIHGVLGSVAHALPVPEDVGRHILSLTEGWENFWIDYDLLSAVHAPALLVGHNVVCLDAVGQDSVDVLADGFKLESVPENVRVIVAARRRLLVGVSSDSARLALICARVTAVDILLRQPKKSPMFLSSYFQSFPSFICQVASVASLMAHRAVSLKATSVEAMIAFAGMSLLSTVITETNHVTQALSVLSANNPHSGILSSMITTSLSQAALLNGFESFSMSKSAIYVLMSSIQNAKHPSTVANATMLRKILDVLVDPATHPEVTHACCVCLEVALEFSHTSFSILFRDLNCLDRLIDRGVFLVDIVRSHEASDVGEVSAAALAGKQKGLNSVFSLLRFSFQTQEIHVGINLHEKLSNPVSPLRDLLVSSVKLGTAGLGKSPFNGCLTLIGNVMADDPLIISTFVECGIVAALADASMAYAELRNGDVLASLFVGICATLLHDSGVKKLADLGDPIGRLLTAIASDEFENSAENDQKRRNSDENRIVEDIGLVAGQTCDDVIRNRGDMKTSLVDRVVEGLQTLLDKDASYFAEIPLWKRCIPGLRILVGGLLSTSDLIELFAEKGGVRLISKLITHPLMDVGVLVQNLPGTSRHHPLVTVFKQIGLRGGRPNAHVWQLPLAEEMKVISADAEMSERKFSRIASMCMLLNVAGAIPTVNGTIADLPSGSAIYITYGIMKELPRMFALFASSPGEGWTGAAWVAVKNFITTIARISNALLFVPPGSLAKPIIEPGLWDATLLLNKIVVDGVLSLVRGGIVRATVATDMTEFVDILSRLLIEDKNHSIRPLGVLEFQRAGGAELSTDLLTRVMLENGDPSCISALEAFLIFFERMTSHKRISNSPITKSLLKETTAARLGGFRVEDLSASVTAVVGKGVLGLHDRFMALTALSSVSATAIVKIYSHAVMLGDRGEDDSMLPPSVGASVGGAKAAAKRSKSPAKKRARTATKKPVVEGQAEDIIGLKGEEVILDSASTLGIVSEVAELPFVSEEEAVRVSRSVSDVFLVNCIRLGDKGSCESSVGELIQRHMEYLGVSIVPSSQPIGTKNRDFVSAKSADECFTGKSRTACAILGQSMSGDRLRRAGDAPSKMLVGMVALLAGLGDVSAEVVSEKDWIAPLLALVHQLLDFCLFEPAVTVDIQAQLMQQSFAIIAAVSEDNVKPNQAKAVAHAALAVVSSLLRRRDNIVQGLRGVDVVLSIPAKARTVHTAPLITDILLSLLTSDLSQAIRMVKTIELLVPGEATVDALTDEPILSELMIRDPKVLTSVMSQMLVRKSPKEGSTLVLVNEAQVLEFEYESFEANVEADELVINKLVARVMQCIPLVDVKTCCGLSDLIGGEGDYPFALSVESGLIALSGLLSELSTVREIDDRYNGIQERCLEQLVSAIGSALVDHLSQVADAKGSAVDVNIYKLMKAWAEAINKCSAWISQTVLGMVHAELERHVDELTNSSSSTDKIVLRSYAYAALVFWLVESVDLKLDIIEKLLPVLSARLKRGAEINTLCRFDALFGVEALHASVYALSSRALEAAAVEHSEAQSEALSDEGEDGDAEMSDYDESDDSEGASDDLSEDASDEGDDVVGDLEGESNESLDEESLHDLEMPEAFELEPSSDDEQDDNRSMPSEETESDSDSGDEDEDDEAGLEYDEYGDDFSDFDDYEVDWEEDEDDDENDGDLVIDGGDDFMIDDGNEMLEVADYMMGSSAPVPTGVPVGSPLAGPEPAPVVAPVSAAAPQFTDSTVRKAREALSQLLTVALKEVEPDHDSHDEEESEEPESGTDEAEAVPDSQTSDLLNMTEEDQLAALEGLSPEERASIQQALGLGDDDDDDDDLSFDDMDEEDQEMFLQDMLPPNVRVSHRSLPPMDGQMHMMLEVPRSLGPQAQADAIASAIENMRPRPPQGPKKPISKGEFYIGDEIPDQASVDKLCTDSPQFATKAVNTLSEDFVAALSSVGSMTSRTLMLRNQVPIKPVIEHLLVSLCLDPRSRSVVLENLFSSILKFVAPKNCAWSFPASSVGVDDLMPPLVGVFDGGLSAVVDRALRSLDVNAPGQCRSVGSGRLINMLKFIVEKVPRARLWFAQTVLNEIRTELAHDFGRRTPERRRSNVSTPEHSRVNYTSSDGEGSLVRAVSAQAVQALTSVNPRKVNPITVAVKLLTTPMMIGSPSHSLILTSLVVETLAPFPSAASDASDCNSMIRQAVSEDAIQLLCEFLVDTKNRLRHMPEFDKAVAKCTHILVSLCRDVKVRELVRQRLLATGARLVADMLNRLNDVDKRDFGAVALVRLFRTAQEAFGSKRVEIGDQESFLDFASAITNIDALWSGIDLRMAAHNNLLIGAPSVAQQALQKQAGVEEGSGEPTNKIAALETIARLVPLVELFLSAHDVSAVWKKKSGELSRPGRWSSEPPTEKENAVAKSAVDFIERHRRPINAMVKSRPSILNRAFAPLVAICPHLLDFDNKRAFFRTKLKHQDGDHRHPPPQLKLAVRRDDVFRDSYAKLQIRSKEEWRGKLSITFQGEEGVDAGGLVREWFGILAREIFNPNYVLFTPASGRPSTFLINPASSVNPDHIHYFKFCGRFIGKAVYDNQRIDAYFVRAFYKHMLGKEVTWRDMETTDPDYFKNLNWILENDMTDVDYYSFTVEENEFGKLKVVELVPNGENIRVTEANKQEYVRLVCEHKLTKGVQEQLKAFLQGFHELIPEQIVGSLFDDKELEMLISGLPSIDLEDLKRNTDYVHYTSESDQIKWFWAALDKFSGDELAWFLQFVTGSTQVPLEGFKGLAGMHGPQRFSIHRIRGEERLPTAHTCFNQLDLPDYTSYESLEIKLKQAVREGHSGFGFI